MDKKSPCHFFYEKTKRVIASAPRFLYNGCGIAFVLQGIFCRRCALREPMRPSGVLFLFHRDGAAKAALPIFCFTVFAFSDKAHVILFLQKHIAFSYKIPKNTLLFSFAAI